ncbi:MAG: flippase [Methanosphaera sp.]|nr:flippase [Methanosphaera sp.]
MSVATRVVKNSGFLVLASLISNVFMFLLTLVTARYLGTYNFGLISSALSVIGIFGVFCDLGLGYYAIQKVSRNHDLTSKYFGTAFVLRLILTIITFIIYVIFSYLSGFTGKALGVMIVIGVYMFFNSFTTFYYSLYQSNEKMHYQTIINTVYNVGVFLLALLFIYLKLDVVWIAATYPIAMILSFVLGWIIKIRHYPKFEFDFSRNFLKEIIVNSIPFGITSVFTSIYFWIAGIILTFMSGSVAVGLFSSSQKIILVLSALFVLLSNAVFPVMSQLFVEDKEKLNDLYQKMLKYMLISSVPIVIGSVIYSHDIINIIFGSQYLDATVCLSVLMWAVIFMFLSGTTSTLLNAINKQFLVTKVAAVGAVFSVIMNYILISQYSYVGASMTSVLTELLVLILMLYSLHKTDFKLNIKSTIKPILQVLLANIIMAFVLIYLQLPFVAGVFVAIVVYLVALFVTRAINDEDRKIIIGLVEQVKNR